MTERMENFELIVHIGTGKTGSSSIQKTLKVNNPLLRERGVTYLGLMCEEAAINLYPWQKAAGWPLFLALDKPQALEQLQRTLVRSIREAREKGWHCAIWSNESIYDNSARVMPVLKNLEALGVKVKIIVYIRRHDAYIRSAYLQWGIKHKTYQGPVKPFAEWRKIHRTTFYGVLRLWLDAQWADFAVRNYDVCKDVAADFLEYYGLRAPNIEIRRENDTPNATALALWAMYNSQFKENVLPLHLENVLQQAGVLEKAPVDCDFAALLPKQADVDAIREESAQDRNRINELFRQCSQPMMAETPLKLKEMTVTQNQINAALLKMIKHLSEQVGRLNRQVKELTKEGPKNA